MMTTIKKSRLLWALFVPAVILVVLVAINWPTLIGQSGDAQTTAINADAAALDQKQLPAQQTDPETQPRLQRVECWFDIPEDREIDCARWYFTPATSQDSLPVVVLRDRSADHRDDPVIYLSGGPGNSTYIEPENIESWFYWAQIANLSRDIVLVDQRGTGLSIPKVNCPQYIDNVRSIMGENLTIEAEFQQLYNGIGECLSHAKQQGIDLTDYSTQQSAQDMDAIATALGYDQWNIVGGSYGTRLGLAWMKLQPEKIRAAVLDSVYPPEKGSLLHWPVTFTESFARLWKVCENNEWCDSSPEDIRREFFQTVDYLDQQPQTLTVSLWQGDWPMNAIVNGHRFVSMVFHGLYDDTLHDDILDVFTEIQQGDTTALTRLAENSINSELAPEFNPLVYFAIECSESQRVSEQDYQEVIAQYPDWLPFTRYAWTYDVCRHIQTRDNLETFAELANLQQPTLILSGALDPVTPSEWAVELQAQLPNAQHWHFPSMGHGVINSDACVHESLRLFLDNPQQQLANPCATLEQ